MPQRPRHPEVDQERAARLEPDDQVLAAPLDRGDALALELGRDLVRVVRPHEPRVVDLDALEAPPVEHGREPRADGLDLGQLGHAVTLAATRIRQPIVSSTIGRGRGGSSPSSYAASTSAAASSRARLVARVDLGERLAVLDRVAALLQADDADRVVDRVVLLAPAGAEVERRDADAQRAEPRARSPPRGANTSRTSGAFGSAASSRVAALRADPALVGRVRRAVGDGRLRAAPRLRRGRCRGRRARAGARTRRARAR